MSENEFFLLTKKFIEEKPAVKEALRELRTGVSIEISLEDRLETHCFYKEGQCYLQQGKAPRSDVRFVVNAESVRRLSDMPCDNLAQTGIEIIREILAGHIQLQLIGSAKNILTDGYLGILRKAGPDLFSFLAEHGLKNIFKVMAFIKNMKKHP